MTVNTDSVKIKEILERGVEDVIVKEHLKEALSSGRQLRVKFGIDPTRPDIHLGHSVPLRKLRAFQELGHHIILIIGDFTAKIGDPSGRSEARKPLTDAEIQRNMVGYLEQAGKIVDVSKAEIVYNSEWFGKESIAKMVELASAGSIQQVLKRADFQKRLQEESDITLLEVLYPLFQGYDSVMVKADVELGGTDQLFNVLMGRRVQRHYGQPEQNVLTSQLLEGTDGAKKMSKSSDNYIGVAEEPNDMFGKIMSVPDTLILKYFWLCTDISQDDLDAYEKRMSEGANPRDIKAELGKKIVALYHSPDAAEQADAEFEKKFSKRETSAEVRDVMFASGSLKEVLVVADGMSGSAAVRLVEGGSVSVNGVVMSDWNAVVKQGDVIQFGKKKETIKLIS